VSHDGRALFMMPWQDFRHFSDEDVASVVAYLRTLPAVKKARETTAIAAPVRWFVKAEAAPLTAPVAEAPANDPIARGRHLAEVGQCQRCHTPVDARHQPLAGMAFAGGQTFVIDGVRYRSANITPDPSGIAHYDEALFVRAMRTGNVGGRRLAPIMPWSDIGKLTDDDLRALWAFLKTVAPVAHDVERTPVDLKDNPELDDRVAAAPTHE
jgi:mono/diheme cytochrome c family protein